MLKTLAINPLPRLDKPDDSVTNQILIYELADSAPLLDSSSLVANVMLPRVPIDEDHTFYISPGSGWLSFSDHTELWQASPIGGLPQTGPAALGYARKFIDRVASDAAKNSELQKRGLSNFAPPANAMVPSAIFAIQSPNFTGTDHWLCCFDVLLTANSETHERLPILGGTIEIRIGRGGKVIGFWWRWRRILRLPFLVPRTSASNGGSDSQLVYLSADEGVPQRFLAPYYLSLSGGDDPQISPASSYSLIADVIQEPKADGVTVLCGAAGGSGAYEFEWAYWSPTSPFSQGLVSPPVEKVCLGDLIFSRVTLPQGVHNVMINVTDSHTGANVQIQRMVFTGAFGQPG